MERARAGCYPGPRRFLDPAFAIAGRLSAWQLDDRVDRVPGVHLKLEAIPRACPPSPSRYSPRCRRLGGPGRRVRHHLRAGPLRPLGEVDSALLVDDEVVGGVEALAVVPAGHDAA